MEDSSPKINSNGKERVKHYLFCILTLSLFIFHPAVYSCSMEMTSASALVIQEILKTMQQENKPSDREIIKIEKIHLKNHPYWTYVIETSINGAHSHCQAMGYSANIDPSCRVKVERIKTPFICR